MIRIFIPFYLMSLRKNFIHDNYSNSILLTMFKTINTVFILENDDDELLDDYDLKICVYFTLKQPKTLLSIICNAFEYFWNTLVD